MRWGWHSCGTDKVEKMGAIPNPTHLPLGLEEWILYMWGKGEAALGGRLAVAH